GVMQGPRDAAGVGALGEQPQGVARPGVEREDQRVGGPLLGGTPGREPAHRLDELARVAGVWLDDRDATATSASARTGPCGTSAMTWSRGSASGISTTPRRNTARSSMMTTESR